MKFAGRNIIAITVLLLSLLPYQNCAPQSGFKALDIANSSSHSQNANPLPDSGSPEPSPQPNPQPNPSPNPNPNPEPVGQPAVQFFGRFDQSDGNGPHYSWSGSAMVARFQGTSVSVTLNEENDNIYYAFVIDQQPVKRFAAGSGVRTYPLASNLSSGEHQILLMRDTEGNEGVSQFRGFQFGSGGQLLAPRAFSSRYRLEVIGDSNTAGYGNLGSDPCGFSTATESAFHSYAQQTAILLGARPSTNISYSGIGIYRNWGKSGPESGFPAMPGFYLRTLTNSNGTSGSFSNQPSQQPNVVVINLGANDFWDGGSPAFQDFYNAYKGLVQTIRSHYPNAYLIAAIRSGSEAKGFVQRTANQLQSEGVQKLRYLELPLQDSGGVSGCNGHASKQAHFNSAQILANTLQGLSL